MTYKELLKIVNINSLVASKYVKAIVELHKPFDSADTPHKAAIGWCKGCSVKLSEKEYISHPYPCPTIKVIEKELQQWDM